MAITGRYTLEVIIDAIRHNLGEGDASLSRIADTQTGTRKWSVGQVVNHYLQNLRSHVASRLRTEGVSMRHGEVFLNMYRTSGTISDVTAGSSTAYLPEDFDGWIAFHDTRNNRPLYVVKNPTLYHYEKLRNAPPGPPKSILIEGGASNSGTWQRRIQIYPTPVSGVSPSISVDYYRIPATMAEGSATTEKPDIDPEFQDILILGPTVELMLPHDPQYAEFRTKETEMLLAIARASEQ